MKVIRREEMRKETYSEMRIEQGKVLLLKSPNVGQNVIKKFQGYV